MASTETLAEKGKSYPWKKIVADHCNISQ